MSKIIKIALGDDMRRKTYNENISFDGFVVDVKNTFNIPNESIIIKFQDKIIDTDEQFLYILNNTQNTIRFDIQKRNYDDLYVQEEIKVKEVPKQQIPEIKNNNNNQVPNPRMSSNIMQTLFGKIPEQQPPQQSNPFSMLMGFLPNLMGGNNNNNNNSGIGGMFPALLQNLPNIMKILTENLPKEKLQELIVSILQSIPREQLISILRTALSTPQVQESIISTLMSSLDKMVENPNESQKEVPKVNINQVEEQRKKQEELQRQDELKKQEETRKRIEELKRQQEEVKRKQEEELKKKQEEVEKQRLEEQKRIDEEDKKKKLEEFFKQQENLKKQYEEQRKAEEERKREEEIKLYEQLMREQEERKKMIEEEERKRQEEEKKELEEEERKRQEEEKMKIEQERKRQEEENLRKQEENKRNQIMQALQNNGIPFECYRDAEELGLIESYGIEKVAQLLIKYKGNVEMVANELFN